MKIFDNGEVLIEGEAEEIANFFATRERLKAEIIERLGSFSVPTDVRLQIVNDGGVKGV